MKKIIAAAGVLTLSLGLGLSGCSGSSSDEDNVAVQSVSFLAGLGTVGQQNRYSGVVVAQATHSVNKEEDQKVKKLKVAVGDVVKKGDVLFVYDTEDIQNNIEMGNLELEKSQNTIDSTNKQIEELQKEKAKAAASEQLSYSIQIQELEADVKEEQYEMETKKVELERLKKSKKNAKVKAEYDGVIQSINEDGGTDDSGNELAYITIVEIGNYRVKGTVNETNVADIGNMEGESIIIRSRVDSEQTWAGTMGAVDTENPVQSTSDYYYDGSDDSSDSSSNYPFYVEIEDSEGLMMGQHVYIELDQGQDDEGEGIWLSSEYLCDVDGKAYVWAATDKDKLEKRNITIGEYNEEEDTYEITDGLTAEDYVAIPADTLKNGLPVTRYDDDYFGDDSSDGDYSVGDYSEGDYSEGDYSDSDYSDSDYSDSDYSEGDYSEGDFSEGDYLDEDLSEDDFVEEDTEG